MSKMVQLPKWSKGRSEIYMRKGLQEQSMTEDTPGKKSM